MILQELIRNWILYREVLKPILGSWKDSLRAGYSKEIFLTSSSELNLALINAKGIRDGGELGWDTSDEYHTSSLNRISGTHTITKYAAHPMHGTELLEWPTATCDSALISKGGCILLRGNLVDEKTANKGKTSSSISASYIDFSNLALEMTGDTTTGFESKQINTFLIETHEKREYLGEFSLTHEETPLMYQLEGGEYSDFY